MGSNEEADSHRKGEKVMSNRYKIFDMKLKKAVAEFDSLSEASEKQLELNERMKEKGKYLTHRYAVVIETSYGKVSQ